MVVACPFPSARGSQVFIRCIAEGLRNLGHEIHVVTYPEEPGGQASPAPAVDANLRLHRVRSSGPLPHPLSPRRVRFDLNVAIELFRVVRDMEIDVIHAHNYHGQLIAWPVALLTGVPLVYHAHNVLADELPWYVRSLVARRLARIVGHLLDRMLPRLARHVVAITPSQAVYLQRQGVPAHRITTIAPRVTPVTPSPTGDGSDPFPGRFVVMYAGNLDGYQNLDLLERGFARFRSTVPNALLVLLGHGGGTATASTGVERSGVLRMEIPSVVEQAHLWAHADVLICPRTSWSGFPIKLINYLAAGRAILASDAAAEIIVDSENGLLFRCDDADSLAAQLQRLYDDAPLRERLGRRAAQDAQRFSQLDDASLQLEGVYRTLREGLGMSRRRRPMFQGLIGFRRGRISAGAGRPSAAV